MKPSRHIHRTIFGVAAALTVLLAAGCTTSGKTGTGKSSSSALPTSSSASSSAAEPYAEKIAEATKVFQCSATAFDMAKQNPGVDHYAELRKCAGDPALTVMVSSLKKLAQYQVYGQGASVYSITATNVTNTAPFSVDLTVCVDQSTSATIDSKGEKLPDPPDGLRHVLVARVEYYTSESGFLVQQLHPQDATC